MNSRKHITCEQHTNIAIADIGFKRDGAPSLFLWCRAHREFHDCTLEEVLAYFHNVSAADWKLREIYIAILNNAVTKCYVE